MEHIILHTYEGDIIETNPKENTAELPGYPINREVYQLESGGYITRDNNISYRLIDDGFGSQKWATSLEFLETELSLRRAA